MLRLSVSSSAGDARTSRRMFLRAGATGVLGLDLSLAGLLRAANERARAKSLILFALEGGPSHIDLWDMKPEAPEMIRGEFRPIATTAPGLLFCEHLPRLATQAHHLTVVRSVHHTINDHNAGYYQAMTGRHPLNGSRLIVAPSADNFPSIGSVVAKLRPPVREVPEYVHMPDWMSNNNAFLPGQDGGFLGSAFDPLVCGDPSLPGYRLPGFESSVHLSAERLSGRHALLEAIDREIRDGSAEEALETHQKKAFRLISGREAREAFDLSLEPEAVRERYGLDARNKRDKEARQFGGLPHLGQCLLLARRLIEAGVRVVTVCTGARYDQSWDTHRQHFPLLKRSILPMFDRGFSALLEDLHQRGLLDETLVVAMGEFGRTPRVGQITSSAGADRGGRDHWPSCYTVLFAGGGMPPGSIFGASDRFGAHPARDAVTPQDIAATIYQAMGLAPSSEIRDPRQGRPFTLSTGNPIAALLS